MWKLIIFVLGLTAATAQAQEQSPAQESKVFPTAFSCMDSKKIFQDLTKQYGEEPIALGKGMMRSSQTQQYYEGNMVLWKNKTSATWTLTMTPKGDEATTCYVISGTEFTEISVSGTKTSNHF